MKGSGGMQGARAEVLLLLFDHGLAPPVQWRTSRQRTTAGDDDDEAGPEG